MSIGTPAAAGDSTGEKKLRLPTGVVLGPGYETSVSDAQGQVMQGVQYPVTLPGGTKTSVFVDYAGIHDLQYVQGLFNARIDALLAIGG
jgi:hypothetical protein